MEGYRERLPQVIDAVATDNFYPNLLTWLSDFILFDNAIIYAFENDTPPHCLIKVERRNSDSLNRIYQQGAYLMDPFYQQLIKGGDNQLFTLKDLAPNGFYRTDYYLNFYRRTGWQDEAGLLIELSPDKRIGLFFGNEEQQFRLEKQRQTQFKEAIEIISSVARLHRQIQIATVAEPSTPSIQSNVRRHFSLTPREYEVVELILAGKGTPYIAQALFISPGTVKNHRKNIYQKLNINSQAELFNLLMSLKSP